jgi:hypothetical protein
VTAKLRDLRPRATDAETKPRELALRLFLAACDLRGAAMPTGWLTKGLVGPGDAG